MFTGPLVLHAAGAIDLTLAPSTHPGLVLLGAAAACVGVLGIAAGLGLPRLVSKLAHQHQSPDRVIHELAELAGVVREHGLLHALVDPRAHGRDVFLAGVQLLLRDADEPLLRATLESETERVERTADQPLAASAAACRMGSAAMIVSLAAAGAMMLRVASNPSQLTGPLAIGILAAGLAGAAGWAACGPGAALFRMAVARRAFARLAERHAVEAIRLGESRELALRRLEALLPEMDAAVEHGRVRQAA